MNATARLRLALFGAPVMFAIIGLAWWFVYSTWIEDEFFQFELGSNGACFGQLVNKTEDSIRSMHGAPLEDHEGYQPLGSRGRRSLPTGRIRTLVFRGNGGINNIEGTIVAYVVERWRGWVCFDSVWFGSNVIFG